MKNLKIYVTSAILLQFLANNSYSASLPTNFTATIAAAPTINQITPLSFDVITGNTSSTSPVTYTIDTANTITTSGSGLGSYVGTSATSGTFTVTATAGQNLTIYVNNYTNGTAPGGNNITVGAATCKYGTSAAATCDGNSNALLVSSGAVTAVSTLKVGISMTVPASTSTAGIISGLGYTVNVLYT